MLPNTGLFFSLTQVFLLNVDTLTSVLRADNGDEQTKTNTSTQRLDEGAYGGEVVSQGF